MKVRVYKTPTKESPGKVAIGLPESLQANTNVSSLNITQQEILPPPSTLSDLFVQPAQVVNPPVNAMRSVAESTLTPGFKIAVTPIGVKDSLIPPLEVEEVTIPENVALPLDDIVAADPTLRPSVRVAIPDAIFKPNVVICIPLVAVTIPVEYMSVTTS